MPTATYVLYSSQGDVLLESSWVAAQALLKKQYLALKCPALKQAQEAAQSLRVFLEHSRRLRERCFSDGAYRGGRAVGAAFFGPGDSRNAVAALDLPPHTSQRAELWGAILAFRAAGDETICLVTDSAYVFRALAEGVPDTWEKNRDLLDILKEQRRCNGCLWTRGHVGCVGNQAAHDLCQTLFLAHQPLGHCAAVGQHSPVALALGQLDHVAEKCPGKEARGVSDRDARKTLQVDGERAENLVGIDSLAANGKVVLQQLQG